MAIAGDTVSTYTFRVRGARLEAAKGSASTSVFEGFDPQAELPKILLLETVRVEGKDASRVHAWWSEQEWKPGLQVICEETDGTRKPGFIWKVDLSAQAAHCLFWSRSEVDVFRPDVLDGENPITKPLSWLIREDTRSQTKVEGIFSALFFSGLR